MRRTRDERFERRAAGEVTERSQLRGFPEFETPFMLAPMAGVTDDVFRRLCREQGAALVYSEMVSAKALHYGDAKSLRLLAHTAGSFPIAYQLFGSDPEVMAEAVARLDGREREGELADAAPQGRRKAGRGDSGEQGRTADGCPREDTCISCVSYDVNMGCPVAKVVRNGEGSALMRDPDRAARIVEAMARATDKPVTVKMRSGWDAVSAASGVAEDFARAMEQAGAAAVAVHGRTKEQYYGGAADWDVIARVKDAVSVPVIGSGDVMSAADAERMLRESGCDYVMIARGALGDPWIFGEAAALWTGERKGAAAALLVGEGAGASRRTDMPAGTAARQGDGPVGASRRPGAQERARMFIRHARMLMADKGEYVAVREMRKHAGWYFKGLPGVSALRAKVNAAQTMAALTELVTDAFLRSRRCR
jgi:tRNA-dihydrouridine synthase B